MKGLIFLAVLFLVGCGSFQSMETLEAEATLTGDWSKVERREQSVARRKARRGPSCPDGYIAYCEANAGHGRCTCMPSSALSLSLLGH